MFYLRALVLFCTSTWCREWILWRQGIGFISVFCVDSAALSEPEHERLTAVGHARFINYSLRARIRAIKKRKRGDGRNTPSLWKTISPRDIYGWRHPRGYGNRGKQRRNRWVAAFPSRGIPGRAFSLVAAIRRANNRILCAEENGTSSYRRSRGESPSSFCVLELKYLIIG